MKILQLGKFYPILGGVEKVMYDLMTGLASRGVDCDMMCASAEGPRRREKINGRATLYVCRTIGKFASTMISPEMVSLLKKECGRYDIIHIHAPDPMACLALYFSGYRGKVVLHWHSDILKNRVLLALYGPFQKWLIRRADMIVGTTPVYVEKSPYLQKVQHKVGWIPIGIPPMQPDPEKVRRIRDAYPGKRIIFSLGRLIPYKGYRYLVEAASLLDDSYMVLIGGSGPLKDALQSQIDSLGLGARVRLLGHVADEDLPSWFGACDLFCMSSIYKTEACGIVQLEAMSCAKPVVATLIPDSGVPWVNRHGVSGLNAEPGNPAALADAVKSVFFNGQEYRRYSQNALERYRTVFTKDNMLDECMKLYERLYGKEC